MTYVMADLHGCYGKYLQMLEKIGFGDDDTLFILGDVIDRELGGIEILKDMMNRKNVTPLIGNHESLALRSLKHIRDDVPEEALIKTKAYRLWMLSDGDSTATAFRALPKETQIALIDYIESFSIYKEITVGGQTFHLSHTLPDYRPGQDIHNVSFLEFIWGEPDYTQSYGDNTRFITGHTPTNVIDPAFFGKIWQRNNHIDTDCAAAWGGRLGCLCLDTMEEFYT